MSHDPKPLRPSRAPAHPVVAVRCRQVDADAQPRARTRPASASRSPSRRAASGPSEIEGMHYISSTSKDFRRCATAASFSNGPKCTATTTARRASPSSRRSPPAQDMMFDIDWQGTRQIVEKMRRRRRQRLHPAALDGGIEGAARAPRGGHARGDRPAPAQRARSRSSAGRSTTTCSSTTISTAPSTT